ncbi:MAG: diguanylate cyclase [Thermodesulfobacteriota bacterium]
MFRKLSIAFPIIGMILFIVISITLSFYIAQIKAIGDALSTKENSKAEDIYYVVESLIEREEDRLHVLTVALKKHRDLLEGLTHFHLSSGDITPLKKAMDDIFLQAHIDLFQVIETDGRIIYCANRPYLPGETVAFPELEKADRQPCLRTAVRIGDTWALISMALLDPAQGPQAGILMVGTFLNDDFAKIIAAETEGHVAFGALEGIIASSLPFEKRTDVIHDAMRESIREIKSIRIDQPSEFKVMQFSPMEVTEKLFSVMVEIDTRDSHDLIQENKTHIIKFSGIILVIAVSLGILFTIHMIRPLKSLQRKARDTVRNISGIDLKQDKGNEIQSMIGLFDALVATATDHIAERIEAEEELKKYQERLEDQIAERTSELRRANQKLRHTVGELELRTSQTMLFNQIGDLLQACDKEEETYAIVERFCRKLFPDNSGYLGIYHKTRKTVVTVASWGDDAPGDNEFGTNQCWAIRMGSLHLVKNPEVDPICPHLADFRQCCYLCAPMIAQGELLGIIHLRFGRKDNECPEDKLAEDLEAKQLLVVSLLEHYAPPLMNLRLRETLRIQSIHDPLTGLYNRRHMTETLQFEGRRAQRHGTSLGIIMVDVDHFKRFNDQYSHEIGDMVLCELANFLKNCIRQEDIVCRYGGEEFVLILPETSLENARLRAEDLRKKIETALMIHRQGRIYTITVSMGVAAYPLHGPEVDNTLNAADAALHQAKTEGRNRVASAPAVTDVA